MSRRGDLSREDRRIWARVTGSVTPPKVRKAPRVGPAEPPPMPLAATPDAIKSKPRKIVAAPAPAGTRVRAKAPAEPQPLEPNRHRRLGRERDPIDARIDLHGFGRFQAEDALVAFLTNAQARGHRAVLVITGQGRAGGTGVIKASVGEWLASARLRQVVSGFAQAAPRHGGAGALYVTLRRP